MRFIAIFAILGMIAGMLQASATAKDAPKSQGKERPFVAARGAVPAQATNLSQISATSAGLSAHVNPADVAPTSAERIVVTTVAKKQSAITARAVPTRLDARLQNVLTARAEILRTAVPSAPTAIATGKAATRAVPTALTAAAIKQNTLGALHTAGLSEGARNVLTAHAVSVRAFLETPMPAAPTATSLTIRVAEAAPSIGIGSARVRSSVASAAVKIGVARMTSVAVAQATLLHAAPLPRTVLNERKAR